MRRRDFTIMLACCVVPGVGLRAQQSATPVRIGILGFTAATASAHLYDAFRDELRRLGFAEGRDVALDFARAEGRPDLLPALARSLVARKVDVIFVPGVQGALAAKEATSTIPIVFVAGSDPVEVGLVSNIGRPGAMLRA